MLGSEVIFSRSQADTYCKACTSRHRRQANRESPCGFYPQDHELHGVVRCVRPEEYKDLFVDVKFSGETRTNTTSYSQPFHGSFSYTYRDRVAATVIRPVWIRSVCVRYALYPRFGSLTSARGGCLLCQLRLLLLRAALISIETSGQKNWVLRCTLLRSSPQQRDGGTEGAIIGCEPVQANVCVALLVRLCHTAAICWDTPV